MKKKVSELFKCVLGGKLILVENHCFNPPSSEQPGRCMEVTTISLSCFPPISPVPFPSTLSFAIFALALHNFLQIPHSHASLCPHTHAVFSTWCPPVSYLINPTFKIWLGVGITRKPILTPFPPPTGILSQAPPLCSHSTFCKPVTALITPFCSCLSLCELLKGKAVSYSNLRHSTWHVAFTQQCLLK